MRGIMFFLSLVSQWSALHYWAWPMDVTPFAPHVLAFTHHADR